MCSFPRAVVFATQTDFIDTDFIALDPNNGSWNVVSVGLLGIQAA